MRNCVNVHNNLFLQFKYEVYNLFIFIFIFYKFTLSEVSINREVNLLNKRNANLLVPMSDVLSAEATVIIRGITLTWRSPEVE